jgi:DNA-binding protein Fis
MPVF